MTDRISIDVITHNVGFVLFPYKIQVRDLVFR